MAKHQRKPQPASVGLFWSTQQGDSSHPHHRVTGQSGRGPPGPSGPDRGPLTGFCSPEETLLLVPTCTRNRQSSPFLLVQTCKTSQAGSSPSSSPSSSPPSSRLICVSKQPSSHPQIHPSTLTSAAVAILRSACIILPQRSAAMFTHPTLEKQERANTSRPLLQHTLLHTPSSSQESHTHTHTRCHGSGRVRHQRKEWKQSGGTRDAEQTGTFVRNHTHPPI